MTSRRLAFLLCLFLALVTLAPLAIVGPARASAHGEEKKKGGGLSFIQVQTLTATSIRPNGRRGVVTVEVGLDIKDTALHDRVDASQPRLRAAYVKILQAYVYALPPGSQPDAEYLSQVLQRETDRIMVRRGAKLLVGSILVN
jgi:hypothetical protein